MKLWDKGYTINNVVDRFTVGNDRVLDLKLARYDVQGNLAHAKMLAETGFLSETELAGLEKALHELLAEIEAGNFVIEEQFEDVHSKIEYELVQRVGDAGKKIHTARSRNDQVLVDMHLYVREEIKKLLGGVEALFERLLALAEEHQGTLLPGYTHTQVAMPSSFGLWFSAYAESLIDDVTFLQAAYRIADQNPLGSAAGYGSSFPISRTSTTESLGFSRMKYNVVAAQMSRGKLERSLSFALAALGGTLSRFAADVCLYISQNFNFIAFPKELTTGSSIMPHKKNPDVFELIRAHCNRIQNLPNEITLITNNLTSGYHRDLQLLKESLMGALDQMGEVLDVAEFMLRHIIIKDDILQRSTYKYIFSVEAVNKLVQQGIPFRDAYLQVGQEIEAGTYTDQAGVQHSHEGSIGQLCLDEIRTAMQAELTR